MVLSVCIQFKLAQQRKPIEDDEYASLEFFSKALYTNSAMQEHLIKISQNLIFRFLGIYGCSQKRSVK